jgi:diadenosine tetraphosphate (Ap4A) HIT family hydrolase
LVSKKFTINFPFLFIRYQWLDNFVVRWFKTLFRGIPIVIAIMHFRLFSDTCMMAGFWLPLLARTVAKVTGVADYNIVQNNGKSTCKLCSSIKTILTFLSLHALYIASSATHLALSQLRTVFPGVRAAQVVPHVHFHIIPRPETMPEVKNKNRTMFGRGQRDDLDEEEAVKLAEDMRRVLRDEVGKLVDGDPKGRL